MIATTLHLLEATRRSDVHFDYVHSISGQDYPVVGNEEFDDRMERADGFSFMWYDRDEEHAKWIQPGGYYERRYRWWCLSRERVRSGLMKKVLGKFDQYSRVFLVRKKIEGIRAGWSWFTWHHSVVDFVLDFMERHPEYLRRFHHTYCCDELIFHTLLYPHLDRLKIHKDNALRYIEWHPKRSYSGKLPLLLEETEYDDIIGSGALFCRKVDGKASVRLLDQLDEYSSKQHHYNNEEDDTIFI